MLYHAVSWIVSLDNSRNENPMKEYRITTMVTVDVLAASETLAVKYALDEIDDHIRNREDTKSVKNPVVTGIAQTLDGEFMVFEQKRARA